MHPSQYSALNQLGGTSTGDEIGFGFNATYLRLVNRGGVGTAYFNISSTGAASTSDGMSLSSGETFEANIAQCAGIGLTTASTSTGDGVDVLALG